MEDKKEKDKGDEGSARKGEDEMVYNKSRIKSTIWSHKESRRGAKSIQAGGKGGEERITR